MGFQKVLLIDDDEDDQEVFLAAVEEVSESVKCIVMSDASEALRKLEQKEVAPDVIFLDLNMPVMNGQQFLVEIKKRNTIKDIPVIIFSTSSHVHTIEIMKHLGAHAFITKPDDYDEIVRVLKTLLI